MRRLTAIKDLLAIPDDLNICRVVDGKRVSFTRPTPHHHLEEPENDDDDDDDDDDGGDGNDLGEQMMMEGDDGTLTLSPEEVVRAPACLLRGSTHLARQVWDAHDAQGFTLQVFQPQQHCLPLARLMSSLEDEFGTLVGANSYLTPSHAQVAA